MSETRSSMLHRRLFFEPYPWGDFLKNRALEVCERPLTPMICSSPNNDMSEAEKKTLQTAILTIADPNGNWDYGWQLICNLADMDPATYKPHFANTEIRKLFQTLDGSPTKTVGRP